MVHATQGDDSAVTVNPDSAYERTGDSFATKPVNAMVVPARPVPESATVFGPPASSLSTVSVASQAMASDGAKHTVAVRASPAAMLVAAKSLEKA
jgi:hypothetical protein